MLISLAISMANVELLGDQHGQQVLAM